VIVSLVPGAFLEAAIALTNERLPQAVAVIVELERKAALQAGVRVIHLRIDGSLNAEHLVALRRTLRLQPTPQ
jgi:hypothetical protein